MIKDQEGASKKLARICPGSHNVISVTSPGQATTPPEGIDKGEGSSVTSKTYNAEQVN